MDPICTATTSSGKKCTRCVEKHGVKYCWQHSKTPKTKSSKTPKKTSPKRGSPKKMSPKKEAFDLEQLPKEVLYEVLLRLPYERLNSVCRTSKKIAKICIEERFQEEYKAKHPEHQTMFVGELRKPTMYDIRKKPGTYIFHDGIGNKLIIHVNDKEEINTIEYTPLQQFYGLKQPENYEPLSVYANKTSSKIIKPGGWTTTIQRSNKNTFKAYTGPGYMGDIYKFLVSIGKSRWKYRMNETPDGYISLSPTATLEFLTIIKNELDKLWPKKK
jgi:hypothetical protein